ncbi:FAD:protein FMN transferase [Lactobacillus sp. LC28-10]|uniref:FAD:protein FMN transferase n=1 Tax=Secundilactobacillus angelensis TaxID=2722706 RepID=A0ABX1KWF0_9LACO|nr:FAD:protein FMN transferase [Secundilactobacillus angelensis]MCH5461871.1 FAD:protein FMN transferase [Secundilactobacillus angelensis]NLR17358.1 FAD:protein FMN transferase [Secundilactobacillus angelensis]
MIQKQYYGLGTAITLSVNEPATTADLDAGNELIKHYEDILTVNRPVSEVMSINHAAGHKAIQVSDITYQLIKRAVEVSQWQLGFNTAIGPLVKLWKIGFDGANLPADEDIKKRLQLIDPTDIKLDDDSHSVFLTKAGMEIDLGAIAKGYIADAIKDLWVSRGVQSGIVDLGGNILLVGDSTRPNGLWRIGIQNPLQQRHVALGVLTTPAKSVVTSGIYERYLVINGHNYHHMFDSKTGYPIQNDLESVTIVSDLSIDGDIWTTEAFYQDIDKGMPLIEKQPGLDAIFVTRDFKVAITSGIKDSFVLTDSDYHII